MVIEYRDLRRGLDVPVSIGREFRRLRNRKQMGLREFGAMFGVSNATMSRLESEKQSPNVETLRRMTEGTGFEIHLSIFDGEVSAYIREPKPELRFIRHD